MGIEKLVKEYCTEGLIPREIYNRLLEKNISCSLNTIRAYHRAYNGGFPSYGAYLEHLEIKRRFISKSEFDKNSKRYKEPAEMQEDFEKHSNVFRDIEEYELYTGDDNFRIIYHSNKINDNNPFMDIYAFGDLIDGPEDNEYVRRGIEILTELERI